MSQPANPFADPRRRQSEELALRAEQTWAAGQRVEACKLFAEAAALEQEVALAVSGGSIRIRGVLAISAVALWYKAGEFARAKHLAYVFLADGEHLSEQGKKDLEELVDRCSREGETARLVNDLGMIPVDVKLNGGRVGVGVAPAAATQKRRQAVNALLMRSADLEAGNAYRDRGESELSGDEIEVFEVPALAASYGMRFYVATGIQQKTAPTVTPEKVVGRFLSLALAAENGPQAVRDAIADPQYAKAFIDGFGEIAPDGDDIGTVSCSAPSWKMPRSPPLVFEKKHRDALRSASAPLAARELKRGEKVIEGRLAAVHLTSEDGWIEVRVASKKAPIEIILVEDKKLRAKVATMVDSDVRVYGKWSQKAERLVMTDVSALLRRRVVPPSGG